MENEIKEIMQLIKDMSESAEFIATYKRSMKDFIRKVKLSFSDVIFFVLGKTGNTFDFELLNFCHKKDIEVSTSGICQARAKVKYTAFEELLRATSKAIEPKNLYKGYRLTSFDGMQGELPRTAELMEKYSPSPKAEYPMFHAVAEYDVLNYCYTNAIFAPAPADERELACELLRKHDYEGAEIFLQDRGFPSIQMIQRLEQSGKKYIMRVSTSFLREVNEFGASESSDEQIHVNYDKRRKATSRVKFDGEEYEFDIRCVKIELAKGETEILISNLTKDEMTLEEMDILYNLRWRIETSFLDLKHAVHVEEFIGKKEDFIKQEFYASLIQSNISMMFVEAANIEMNSKKKEGRKLEYAVNKRKLISVVRDSFYDLLYKSFPLIFEKIINFVVQFKSAIRPGRMFKRKFSSCKHPVGYRKNWFGGLA